MTSGDFHAAGQTEQTGTKQNEVKGRRLQLGLVFCHGAHNREERGTRDEGRAGQGRAGQDRTGQDRTPGSNEQTKRHENEQAGTNINRLITNRQLNRIN